MMRSWSMSIVLFFKFLLMLPLEMTPLEEDPLLVLYSLIAVVLTTGSSTEAEFIADVTAAKLAQYLHCVLKQLGEEQTEPTDICIDNLSALKIINDNFSPTEQTCHMDLRFFSIQDWREAGDIIMKHIPGVLNPSDNLNKPLGWVLHARH